MQAFLISATNFVQSEKVRETLCPEWNPQRGLCPLEENRAFQGIAAGTHLFILLSYKSKS